MLHFPSGGAAGDSFNKYKLSKAKNPFKAVIKKLVAIVAY